MKHWKILCLKRSAILKNIYLALLVLSTFTGCFGNKQTSISKTVHQDYISLDGKKHKEDISIYGEIDKRLKVELVAKFEAFKSTDGCAGRTSGWSSYKVSSVSVSSKNSGSFKLALPYKWEESMGENLCDYYIKEVHISVSYPQKKGWSVIHLLMPKDNDNYFKIDGKLFFKYARDYKVRYLTGLSSFRCVYDKDAREKFVCKSGLNDLSIKTSDEMPGSLSYGVFISLRDMSEKK